VAEAFQFDTVAFMDGDLRLLDELFFVYISLEQLQIEGHNSRISYLC
jgi:hypothetical protein